MGIWFRARGWVTLAAAVAAVLLPLLAARPAAAAPAADSGSTLVVIDTPRGGTTSTQLYVSGWAADPRSASGTGVDAVEVYLDGEAGADGTYLGQATYGLARPDVASHLGGSRFNLSGYAMVTNVTPGPHTVYVYAHPGDQPSERGWTAPKTAAVVASTSAAPAAAGAPGVPAANASGGVYTVRPVGGSGSITYDLPPMVGSNYPPGPADTGGPLYAPTYLGWGVYGGIQPFPDVTVPSLAGWVPGNFDFSYGYGYNFYSQSYLASPRFYGPWGYGGYSRFPFGSIGPVYCPVYSTC